jgi:hypothetical protein
MTLTIPTTMKDCLYFTNRVTDNGQILAWVYKKECPKCKKARMGKPVVKGKIKIRAKVYVCPACEHEEEKEEHEASCIIEVKYDCPHCGKAGESTGPYVRKTYKGVKSYLVECEHCKEKIAITKKLKEPKKKKPKVKK